MTSIDGKLEEERQALMSLQSYKSGRVGSVRVPSGTVPTYPMTTPSRQTSNTQVNIYQGVDEYGQGASGVTVSLTNIAKRDEVTKENILKPGIWPTIMNPKNTIPKSTTSFTGRCLRKFKQ